MFFSATDGVSGYELWRSDGTAAGTARVKDVNPSGDAWPGTCASWAAPSTSAPTTGPAPSCGEGWNRGGTVRVADLNPDGGSYPNALLNIDGTLYFRADDGSNGIELWKTDGTADGTVLVADINPAGSSVPANCAT